METTTGAVGAAVGAAVGSVEDRAVAMLGTVGRTAGSGGSEVVIAVGAGTGSVAVAEDATGGSVDAGG